MAGTPLFGVPIASCFNREETYAGGARAGAEEKSGSPQARLSGFGVYQTSRSGGWISTWIGAGWMAMCVTWQTGQSRLETLLWR